jgi:hypothetical protein
MLRASSRWLVATMFLFAACTGGSASSAQLGRSAAAQDPAVERAVTPRYRFTVDGAPVRPKVRPVFGSQGQPVVGDVLEWPGLVLDEEPEQSFDWSEEGRVYQRSAHGRRLVHVRVRKADELASLTDEEARGLRGVEFAAWDAAIAQQLARIDVRQCLLAFPNVWSVDLTDLPASARYLDFHYGPAVEPAAFARFAELRYLVLPDEVPVGDAPPPEDHPEYTMDLAWIAKVPELRYLDVSGVVVDLRPLGGHPGLQTVVAEHARITHLPYVPVPSLRTFTASFSYVPADGIARLRRLHPEASIHANAAEELADLLRSATRLLLRTGSSIHTRPKDQVVYGTEEPSELAAARALLLPLRSGYDLPSDVPAGDNGVLQFFDDDGTLLAEVGLLGGLRCRQAWEIVARFASDEARIALEQWLRARGLRVGSPVPRAR